MGGWKRWRRKKQEEGGKQEEEEEVETDLEDGRRKVQTVGD